MTLYFTVTRFSLYILFILFLGTACNNKGDEKKGDEQAAGDPIKKEPPVVQTTAALIGGPLDTLYTDSSTFVDLPKKKMVFRFIFTADEHLTLHGWNNKAVVGADTYDTLPILKLENGHPSTVMFGTDIYLGNGVIWPGDNVEIRKALKKEKAKYVIFVPKIDTLKTGKHVAYNIFVGSEKPGFVKVFAVVNTGLEINPSPPKH